MARISINFRFSFINSRQGNVNNRNRNGDPNKLKYIYVRQKIFINFLS